MPVNFAPFNIWPPDKIWTETGIQREIILSAALQMTAAASQIRTAALKIRLAERSGSLDVQHYSVLDIYGLFRELLFLNGERIFKGRQVHLIIKDFIHIRHARSDADAWRAAIAPESILR